MKVVGIILLSILCIIIGLILMVLFVPIRYDIMASAHENTFSAKFYIHWLLRMIRFHGEYRDSQLDSKLWILCFGKSPGDSSKRKEENKVDPTREQEKETSDSTDAQGDNPEVREDVVPEIHHYDEEDQAPQIPKKKKHFSLRERWNSFRAKWKDLKHNIHKYKRMLEDPRNRAAVCHLKEEIIRLLKCVMPDKMKLEGSFSTGSPDTTGEVLGILAMFPIGYKNCWKIYPDFESDVAYVEGDTRLIGKIFIFQLVGILIRIWTDKNCRRLYQRLKK